jgi:hypothetical protein
MIDKKQWPAVNLGFKLWPPILKRAAGRPRERRYKSTAEGKQENIKKVQKVQNCHNSAISASTPPRTIICASTPPRAITCAPTTSPVTRRCN